MYHTFQLALHSRGLVRARAAVIGLRVLLGHNTVTRPGSALLATPSCPPWALGSCSSKREYDTSQSRSSTKVL